MDKPVEIKPGNYGERVLDDSHPQPEIADSQPTLLYAQAPLLAVFLLFVGISFLWIKVITPNGLAASTDSIYYMETAASFQEGKGASISNRELTAFGKEKILPVTIWPPLYPALIATVLSEPLFYCVFCTASLSRYYSIILLYGVKLYFSHSM